jgi:hypothetical protein
MTPSHQENCMIPVPTSFPRENTHRVVVFTPDRPTRDSDRLEDIAADALAAAREALLLIRDLPGDLITPVEGLRLQLASEVEEQAMLSEEFRTVAGALIEALGAVLPDDCPGELAKAVACLRAARQSSSRVSDLLAAERAIGAARKATAPAQAG